MKFFKKFMVSIDFSTQISINSLASGGFAPEPTTNAYDHILLNDWHNFREKFDKILYKFWKNLKVQFFVDYSVFQFSVFSVFQFSVFQFFSFPLISVFIFSFPVFSFQFSSFQFQFSIDFSTQISINSLAPGAEPPTNAYF